MALFERAPRPDCTVEGHGFITRLGLFAHGVQSNPLVGPASYLAHSNTFTEAGQKHLESMCQQWTRKAVQNAIDEENGLHDVGPPITKRKACATPLAALLREIEKGRMPTDVLPASYYRDSIGVSKSFNVQSTDHPSERVGERLLRCSTRDRGRGRDREMHATRRSRSAPSSKRGRSKKKSHKSKFAEALVAEARAVARAVNETDQELTLTEKAYLEQSMQKAARAIHATREASAPRRAAAAAVGGGRHFDGEARRMPREQDMAEYDSEIEQPSLSVGASRLASKERALREQIAALDAQLLDLQTCISSDADDEFSGSSTAADNEDDDFEKEEHDHLEGGPRNMLAAHAGNGVGRSRSQRDHLRVMVDHQDSYSSSRARPAPTSPRSAQAPSRKLYGQLEPDLLVDLEESKDDESDAEYIIAPSKSPRQQHHRRRRSAKAASLSPVVSAVRDIMAELSLSPRNLRRNLAY